MDEDIKKRFDAFCADAGMNASVAVNLFARAVLREKRIPFEITGPNLLALRRGAYSTLLALPMNPSFRSKIAILFYCNIIGFKSYFLHIRRFFNDKTIFGRKIKI
jgi:addiction module RelB/DinJ family antitoxin